MSRTGAKHTAKTPSMAEKGGKGFPLSNSKGKTLARGGKANTLGKELRKKVVLDTSSSSDSDSELSLTPKTTTPSANKSKSNADWGKSGGKAGNVGGAKAGVSVAKDELTNLQPKFEIEGELPKNAKCMMDCEALDALQKIQDHLVVLSEDPTIKVPESFHKGLQYAKSGGGYQDSKSARRSLEKLKKHKVSESEICLIGNICPESVDEVFGLVPSLKEKKRKGEVAVEDVLNELIKLRSA